MTAKNLICVDGNEAVALVAHKTNEVIAIYPITPSSSMAELSEEWSAKGHANLWGGVPEVVEMQSEGGAAGAVHGALQAGALTTTFTSSQGLLLMIPNMFKIAGELTPMVMHVAARTVATNALSIFGEHSDVMACRQTGFGMLAAGSVQEAHDMALISQAASLKSRVPFIHFFDGFRTSSEINRIEQLSDEEMRAVIDQKTVDEHRARALSPEHPVVRGTAHNPDTFFQSREAANPYYAACPEIVEKVMAVFGDKVGRKYKLFDYVGHPQAERVMIIMGSGAETSHATVDHLVEKGEKVGLLKVRLYRPFSMMHLMKALPTTVKAMAVMDRTKEPGALGEPLYLDVLSALHEARTTGAVARTFDPVVIGGRYGLSSKEYTPAMVKAVFDELSKAQPKNHFTVGIHDDVSHTSLTYDDSFDLESKDTRRAIFFGLGADGTVGSNKESIKIIGEETNQFAQGYFVYDSKKSGAITVSYLRFGPTMFRAPFLTKHAQFVACHHFNFLEKRDVLACAEKGGTFLLNAPFGPEEIWDKLGKDVQQQILDKQLKFYVVDANKVARDQGMPGRISPVLQTCFFAISNVMPREEAIKNIKESIKHKFGKKGADVVTKNIAAVDNTLENLREVKVPGKVTSTFVTRQPAVSDKAPDFVKKVTATIMDGHGDRLPVSALPVDGTWPTATTQWEKRAIAQEIPVWDSALCIQCNKCVLACPHAAIRPKLLNAEWAAKAPASFKMVDYKVKGETSKYALQVSPDDCTGCKLCVEMCPTKDRANPRHKALNMEAVMPLRDQENKNFEFFMQVPDVDRASVNPADVKGSQFLRPLFEYSGACTGCGETQYVKLLTQLFGDRLLIANATGCSSIYGGNLPTTPYSVDSNGRGPAWANSLFEDNAEFGLGMRLASDFQESMARRLLKETASKVGEKLATEILDAKQDTEGEIAAQRKRVAELNKVLAGMNGSPEAQRLKHMTEHLVRRSVWIVGGDGWAYDIGFGGLDHVLASGRKVNILVLDTEVYSNTGGQQSKATPMGASAKFAASGKATGKKDLGLIAMSYGNVYVARVAFGAKDAQTVKAFAEADAFPGTSIIIAYSHCIAHGYDLSKGLQQQKLAVSSGVWPLYRFDPRREEAGEPAMKLDSDEPKGSLREYIQAETRFHVAEKANPERFARLMEQAEIDIKRRYAQYRQMASMVPATAAKATGPAGKAGASEE